MRKYYNRAFSFTEEKVKEVCKLKAGIWYSDAICKGLRVQTLLHGNGSYVYQSQGKCKTIGNVHRMSLEQARDIAFNITANIVEFLSLDIKDKYLVEDFEKNGFLPRKKIEFNGTEIIISNENASLKEKIKDLQAENESLKAEIQTLSEENRKYHSRLITIKKVVGGVYEEDTEVDD